MNPFGGIESRKSKVESPSGHGPVLTRDAAPPGGDDGPIYETRRSDLKPDVRKYADKLHAQILEIYKKYGASTIKEMQKNALAGKGPKLQKKDVVEIDKLVDALDEALSKNQLPPPERLSLEVVQRAVDEVNEQIAPLKVTNLSREEDFELIDGKLNGIIGINDGRVLPLIDGQLVESVLDGRRQKQTINHCHEVRNVNGSLNGSINTAVGNRLTVIDDKVIGSVLNEAGDDCFFNAAFNVQNIEGHFNGEIATDIGSLPVINGKLIETVREPDGQGRKIINASDTQNIGGKFYGRVMTERDRSFPVMDGVLIHTVRNKYGNGWTIKTCENVKILNGKLNCQVEVYDDRFLPVVDGVLVEEIEDADSESRPIVYFTDMTVTNGKPNGVNHSHSPEARKDVFKQPVIEGKLIETIIDGQGKERWIIDCRFVTNIDGKLNCAVRLSDGYWLPVINGKLVEKIQGEKIHLGDWPIFSCVGGAFTGTVMVRDSLNPKKGRKVLLGKFIE